LATPTLQRLVSAISGLRFPTLGDQTAAQLMDLHLRYRFASSVAAGRETLLRHLRYLDRAVSAARRGERLPRAGPVFSEENDGQLELDLIAPGSGVIDAAEIEAERERISAILASLPVEPGTSPKLANLKARLAGRTGKTIVFTTAIVTARAIARELGWREVAVVSGKGAW